MIEYTSKFGLETAKQRHETLQNFYIFLSTQYGSDIREKNNNERYIYSPPSNEVVACIIAIDTEPINEHQTTEYQALASMKRSESTRELILKLIEKLADENNYWLRYVGNGNHCPFEFGCTTRLHGPN